MTDEILVTTENGVSVVTISYPGRLNALTPRMRVDLGDRLAELMVTPDSRVIVLTGAGGAFCAGADVAQMGTPGLAENRFMLEVAGRPIRTIVRGGKPVIAAVEGAAAGGGFSLAVACDVVVAATTAKFSAAFIKLGIGPDLGILWSLQQRVGPRLARRILMQGQAIEAAEAERIGLVDHLVEPGTALAKALAIAPRFAELPPLALAITKTAFANGCATVEEALLAEQDYQPLLRQSNDHREAVAAFLEKRKARFTGT